MYNRFIIIAVCFAIIFSFAFPDMAFADYPDGYYDVKSVTDGDTFKLTDDTLVRLIGIDAPESGETCSVEATQKLASLIAGKTVYLEKDVSETDIYGRLLRYVYVNDIFVNLELVYDGYAYAVSYPPDVAYDSQLADAEEGAVGNRRGCLWEIIYRDNDSYWAVASCFIATAAYGSPVNPYVKILRKFRDKHLLTHKIGRKLVRMYYSYSPVIAGYISKHDSLKVITRLSLLPVIGLSWVILKFGPETTMMIIMLLSGGLIGIFLFTRK